LSISATARALGLHRHTIEKYDRLPAAPERRHTWRRPSALTPYEGYLQERRRQGARKALPLWRELRALGYTGAYQNVARFMAALRKLDATGGSGLPRARGLTARRTVGLALVRPERRTAAETRALRQVVAGGPEIGTLVGLLEQFARLIRREGTDPVDELASWKQAAVATGWEELGTFVARLEQDQAAVEAALRLPYSQGQTEGQINRLKMLKRAMFGRANFDLLRKRFLAAT
jgi:transposase